MLKKKRKKVKKIKHIKEEILNGIARSCVMICCTICLINYYNYVIRPAAKIRRDFFVGVTKFVVFVLFVFLAAEIIKPAPFSKPGRMQVYLNFSLGKTAGDELLSVQLLTKTDTEAYLSKIQIQI